MEWCVDVMSGNLIIIVIHPLITLQWYRTCLVIQAHTETREKCIWSKITPNIILRTDWGFYTSYYNNTGRNEKNTNLAVKNVIGIETL